MKTLILFSTRDGQTREIAAYTASELKELGIGQMSLMCIALKNPSGKTTIAWSLALLFATVTTILRSRICQKACDAAELDAERLLLRKPGGA